MFSEQELRIRKETDSRGSWPEDYYKKMDPAKRRGLLDEALAARPGDIRLTQIRQLFDCVFDCCYTRDKKGGYADRFLRAWLDLKMTAGNLQSKFAEKKNRKNALESAALSLPGSGRCFFRGDSVQGDVPSGSALYAGLCGGRQLWRPCSWDSGK